MQPCVHFSTGTGTSEINDVYFDESWCVLHIFQMILLYYPHFIGTVHFSNGLFVLPVVIMCTSFRIFSCRWFYYFSALTHGMCISKNGIVYFPALLCVIPDRDHTLLKLLWTLWSDCVNLSTLSNVFSTSVRLCTSEVEPLYCPKYICVLPTFLQMILISLRYLRN